jgi:hypothetical protein
MTVAAEAAKRGDHAAAVQIYNALQKWFPPAHARVLPGIQDWGLVTQMQVRQSGGRRPAQAHA